MRRTIALLQAGRLVAFMVRDSNGTNMTWVQVWRDGKIARQWVVT